MSIPYLSRGYKDPVKLLSQLHTEPEQHWIKRGQRMVLCLFHEAAEHVLAYKDFLKKHGVRHLKVKTIEDFRGVPIISKESYLRQYPLDKLSRGGIFPEAHWDISSTSGSTGEPFYFPRRREQNLQYALTAELYLRNNFDIDKRTTLYVNCFALGVWIGGLFTYEALKLVAERGKYDLTIVNPGLNKEEIIKVVKNLGPYYDQVVIGGYPPFVKDVIDDGIGKGLNWPDYRIKLIFSAEAFSEDFRDYLYKKIGQRNIYLDSLNHYGTVDQGTLAHETPLSILIRRLALKNEKLFTSVFGSGLNKQPTLAQYIPEMFFFEIEAGGLLCSSNSGLPLVRYDLKDHGGGIGFEKMKEIFSDFGIDLFKEAKKSGIMHKVWTIPFVYVYERKDLSVSFCGANIYPETIKRLLQELDFSQTFTGKFTLLVKRDWNQDPFLEINLELKDRVLSPSPKLRKHLSQRMVDTLLKENSEYRSVYLDQKQERAIPRLEFWPYESVNFFKVGGKQKWVIS